VCGGPFAKGPPPSGSSAARIAARWSLTVSAAVGTGLGRRSGCSGRGAAAGVLEGRVAGEAVGVAEEEAGGAFSLSEATVSSSGWVLAACEAEGDACCGVEKRGKRTARSCVMASGGCGGNSEATIWWS
jgi:hypothetical protein